MAQDAASYFAGISRTVPIPTQRQWESDIQDAEHCRHANPSSMDVLGARQAENYDEQSLNSSSSGGNAIERWIHLGIDIKEKQCVTLPCHHPLLITIAGFICKVACGILSTVVNQTTKK